MILYSIATYNANAKAFQHVIYGKMALVLTLIIGAKYINFGVTVLSNFQCGCVQLIWRAIGQGPTSIDKLKVCPTMQSISKLTQDALAQKHMMTLYACHDKKLYTH